MKDGDKVIFIGQNGKIIMANSTMDALEKIQSEFEGEAKRAGLNNEQDVVDFVKQVRREMWNGKEEGNN